MKKNKFNKSIIFLSIFYLLFFTLNFYSISIAQDNYWVDGKKVDSFKRITVDTIRGNTGIGFDVDKDGTNEITMNSTGYLHLGADDLLSSLFIHDAGYIDLYDDSDDFNVRIGPVENGTTILGFTGSFKISNDLYIMGDNIFATTNTIGAIWIGDGTNFNPVVMNSDASIGADGALTVADDSHNHIYSNIDPTTSVNWANQFTDETGTGYFVLSGSPTFTTKITSPIILGGIETTSSLTLQATSGVGTTGSDIHFKVGDNGGNEAITILNNSRIGVNDTTPDAQLDIDISSSTTVGLGIKGAPSQSGNMLQITDSLDSNLFKVESDGDVYADANIWANGNLHSGPIDLGTDPGEVSLYNLGVSSSSPDNTIHSVSLPIDGQDILKVSALSTGSGNVDNKKITFLGDTGYINIWVYQNATLADDATINLPDAVGGHITITCNAETGIWNIQTDGTCTKVVGTANTADTDSDTDLCVYDGGTYGIVKNRLGAEGRIIVKFEYY